MGGVTTIPLTVFWEGGDLEDESKRTSSKSVYNNNNNKKNSYSEVRESIDTESRAFGLKSKPHFQNRPYSEP